MIKAKNLSFTYPGARSAAISNLDLEIAKGSFALLEGAGGAGKSTLIRLLLGVYPLSVGELEVNGFDLRSLKKSSELRRSIGIVSGEADLISDRSVSENVALPLEISGMQKQLARERLVETLHRFGLDHLKHEFPVSLSEGERRRTKLARALVNEPHLLILDEPTLGLDPTMASALWDLLFREHQRGMTILAAVSAVPPEPRFEICQRVAIPRG